MENFVSERRAAMREYLPKVSLKIAGNLSHGFCDSDPMEQD